MFPGCATISTEAGPATRHRATTPPPRRWGPTTKPPARRCPATLPSRCGREVRSDGERLARQNATPSYEETLQSDRGANRAGSFWSLLAIGVVLAALGFTWLLFA
jgi:hypothetical protein